MGELTLPQALDRDPDFRTTAENLMADEIERLQLSLSHARAETRRLLHWGRLWDELGHLMLEDHENTFDHADRVLEAMDAMESRVNPDD
ncbi:MAG: hypothetical protein GY698_24525 [Actinomycetia bacterium]|nr:hypothetical protein [Actinomycetes bacterium]